MAGENLLTYQRFLDLKRSRQGPWRPQETTHEAPRGPQTPPKPQNKIIHILTATIHDKPAPPGESTSPKIRDAIRKVENDMPMYLSKERLQPHVIEKTPTNGWIPTAHRATPGCRSEVLLPTNQFTWACRFLRCCYADMRTTTRCSPDPLV